MSRFKLFIRFGMWCGLFGPQANEDRKNITLLAEQAKSVATVVRSPKGIDSLVLNSLRGMVCVRFFFVFAHFGLRVLCSTRRAPWCVCFSFHFCFVSACAALLHADNVI